ncbi:MFS transporter [Streptantibioticus cattleyicolor]|uniref:Putative transport integral membrane protein n=1 Tax=Streptantibioticus cattleyicolor (strain ATCC 35852 / DSM 46488 / JCM 4925 / NBRC 14057 / NRRL 8057) TaxID=1003195 RepID=F8JMW4_STREN|nr:MFS transporter [Streptantibioticus cattleyicolor]AEW99239.1 putative transport integral membrane protein [Streptantibioticus cattleyicolor NRRL 8057 = DSM 46488]CCB71718.1 Putative drug resistance transporter [Streptantibioticus cattleyicolor NRRL 8057 = DSM 46488]
MHAAPVDISVGSDAPAATASARGPAPVSRHRWWTLAVIGLAQLMVVLDATIVNIALPSAQHDLGFSNDGRQWIVTAYSLAFGSLLLLGGRLADLIGRRTTLLIALAGFGAASALGGAANGFTMLVVARALQGLFGALLAPSAMSLLTTTFTDAKERAKAFGIFGAIAGSGGAIGLLLGGLLTEHLNWRWTLYVNVVIAVFAIAGAAVFVRRGAPVARPKLDVLGTVLVAGGLFAVVFGFSNAETHGWGNWMCWAFLAAGGVLLALFTWWQTRAVHPLLPLRVLADRNRAGSYVSVFISGAGMFGVFLFLTYYLEVTLGYTPVKTGLSFLPMVGALMVMAQVSTNMLVPRLGPKPVVPVGMALAAGGMVWLTALGLHSSYAAHVLPPLLLLGVGLGMVMPPAMSLATLGVAGEDQGVASATVNTMQQVGGSIGTALFNTLAATAATDYARNHLGTADLAGHAALHSYATAYAWAAGFFAVGLVVAVLVYRRGRPVATAPTPAPAATERTPAPTVTPPPASGPVVGGRVLDASGAPVPGAVVTLVDQRGRQLGHATAAPDGRYAVARPAPGQYVLVGSSVGRRPGVVTLAVGETGAEADLVLAGNGTLSGTVRAEGAPVARALVVVADAHGEVAASVTTGDSGEYHVPGLVPGDYTVAVNAAGHRPAAAQTTVDGVDPVVLDVQLPVGARLHGTVRDPAGRPVPQARVALLDANGTTVDTRITPEDGGYAFADLAHSEYTLVASGYPAVATQVTVDGTGRDDLEVWLAHE